MFLLASAFVAFQGWPQVGSQSAPVLVSVPHVSAPTGTRVSRALSATTTAPARGAGARGALGLTPATHVNRTHASRGSDQTTLPVSRDPGTSTGHTTGPTPRTCTSACQSGHGPIPTTQPTVRKTVQGAAGNATSAVGSVVGTVRKVLPISKGSGGGGATGGVVTTATNVVTTATNVVKGATGGLP